MNNNNPKPLVYIASPYTRGDKALNVRFQCEVFNQLLSDELVTPYIPLLLHFQHVILPRQEQDWIEYGKIFVRKSDAVLRLDANLPEFGYFQHDSPGSDGEVKLARELSIPVFFSVQELYWWTKERFDDRETI